jgi:hypothetical protein
MMGGRDWGPNGDPNVNYDLVRCRTCGHPRDERRKDWGCGTCCPGPAPEVPSREPARTVRRVECRDCGRG